MAKKKRLNDPKTAEKINAFWGMITSRNTEEGRENPFLSDLAAELDGDAIFAEHFFDHIRLLGADLPKGFFADLFPLLCGKAAQKALKRAHYLLTQKGFAPHPLPEKDPLERQRALKGQETVQPLGYLSDLDGQRKQMVGIQIPQGGWGRFFLLALVGEDGLESLVLFEGGKKRSKEILADLEKETKQRFYEADFHHTAFILQEAHDRHSALSSEDERLYSQVMGLLEEKGVVGRTPIIRSLLAEDPIDRPPLPVAEDLERMRELIYLLPSFEVLKGYLSKVKEVDDSPVILNDRQKQERIEGIVRRAVEESFPKERWPYLQRYLEETAYLHFLKGDLEDARFLFHWALTFVDQERYPSPAEHPLLNWLMDLVLVEEEGKGRRLARTEERRTPGGIIIPSWAVNEEAGR